MNATIIKTGELIDLKGSSIEYGTMTWIDSNNIFHQGHIDGGIEILEEKKDVDWEQRRYELSKAALQGLLSDPTLECDEIDTAKACIKYADALIKQLKEKVK